MGCKSILELEARTWDNVSNKVEEKKNSNSLSFNLTVWPAPLIPYPTLVGLTPSPRRTANQHQGLGSLARGVGPIKRGEGPTARRVGLISRKMGPVARGVGRIARRMGTIARGVGVKKLVKKKETRQFPNTDQTSCFNKGFFCTCSIEWSFIPNETYSTK